MKNIIALLATIIVLYAASAYAGSALSSFAQGAVQGVEQRTNERNAERAGDDIANTLLDQYKSCLDYDPNPIDHKNFDALFPQEIKCLKSTREAFFHQYPYSPAKWIAKNDGTQHVYVLDDTEKEHLSKIMKQDNNCSYPLLHYSGSQDAYITKSIHAHKEVWNGMNAETINYINGKITRGEFSKRKAHILDSFNTNLEKINDESASISEANWEARKQFCHAQLETNKQIVLQQLDHREAVRVMQRQQRQADQTQPVGFDEQPLVNQNVDSNAGYDQQRRLNDVTDQQNQQQQQMIDRQMKYNQTVINNDEGMLQSGTKSQQMLNQGEIDYYQSQQSALRSQQDALRSQSQ